MAKGKSWFQRGEEGKKRAAEEDAATQARREQRGGPRRFWLKNDTSAKVTYLDTPDVFLHEHNLKLAGKFYNYFTCLKDIDTCPICEDGDQPSYIVAATIIDHRKYTDKDGKEHVNQKKLIVFKGRARQRIMKKIERRDGDIKYCAYEMSRGSSGTECSTGEDFEFIKQLTKAQLMQLAPKGETEDWLKPLDYEEIFKPKTAEDLRKILGGEVPVGAGESEDDDPFPPDDSHGEGEEKETKTEKKETKKSEKKDKPKEEKKESPKVESIEDLL